MEARAKAEILIPRTWRSELLFVVLFVITSVLAIYFTTLFPWSVIEGDLFPIGSDKEVRLRLPLFWFMPVLTIGIGMYRIYNVRYALNDRGIECLIGRLALRRYSTRIWYEDVRSVQTNQSLLQRFLGIGDLAIGTAATGEIEVTLRGIAAPEEVQEMIQRERDKRQKVQRSAKNQQNTSNE